MEIVISVGFGVWLVATGLVYKYMTRPGGGRKK
jgi:hypothetical protein